MKALANPAPFVCSTPLHFSFEFFSGTFVGSIIYFCFIILVSECSDTCNIVLLQMHLSPTSSICILDTVILVYSFHSH